MTGERDLLLESVPGAAAGDLESSLALLSRAKEGDADALNALFVRYHERVHRIVRVRLGPGLRRWTESGDIVQETFRAALQGLSAVPITNDFDLLDWFARVATNRIRDLAAYVRASKRDARAERELDATGRSGSEPVAAQTSPSGQAFHAEVRAVLDEAVGELPDPHREVILLRDYYGVGWEEVARVLGTPSLHAAQQLHQRAWIRVRSRAAPRLAGLRPE